jgi:hypothetical protein
MEGREEAQGMADNQGFLCAPFVINYLRAGLFAE